MEVKKRGDDITFLRRIVRGPADDSYGIEVAKLAGIPDAVVSRAREILRWIEAGDGETPRPTPHSTSAEDVPAQLSLLSAEDPLIKRLRELDVNTLTPIEAMQELYALCKEAAAY